MHQQLVSYLQDNQDQIVETWLTGTAVPDGGPDSDLREQALLRFLEGAFQTITALLRSAPAPNVWLDGTRLVQLLDDTGWCPCDGSRICFLLELREAAAGAFLTVLCDGWDTGEFTPEERHEALRLIDETLSIVLTPKPLPCRRSAFFAGGQSL